MTNKGDLDFVKVAEFVEGVGLVYSEKSPKWWWSGSSSAFPRPDETGYTKGFRRLVNIECHLCESRE